jgi:TRAP-type C4-dicarboxylate transport system permease small subunit
MELPQRSEPAAPPSVLGRVAAALAAIGTGWILVLMFLICADVVGRAAFNAPILGVPEMVQFSIVGIVFLQLPETYRIGGLTRADMLLGGAKQTAPRFAHVLELAFDLVGLALFVVIVTTTWPLMVSAFAYGEFYGSTGVVQIPTGPLKLIIMLGCTMMALQLLVSALRHLNGAVRPASPAAP